jgi:pimeloyl-ACP methyl ester carboxylesterase
MEQVDIGPPSAERFIGPDLAARTRREDVDINGSKVACWIYEPVAPAPDTRTVLVIHGFRGDHHGLLRVADRLPELRIVMPDLPGFGSSEPFTDQEHSVAAYAAFIPALMEALELGPETVLLGHSFGSIIASHFVAAHPRAVRQLILINPIAAHALEGPKGLMTRLAVFYYQASAWLPQPLGLFLLRNRLIVRAMSIAMAKTKDKDLRRYIHGQHDAYFSAFADRDSLLESFRASVGSNVSEVAPSLTLPVLLIAGDEDEIAPLPDQEELAALLPDGTLKVIPGVGHLIHYETPEPAAGHIRSFLKDHPA